MTYASDVLIIQTAIQSSSTANTVVVGEDTDLLILLLHHANMDNKELYQSRSKTQKSTIVEY